MKGFKPWTQLALTTLLLTWIAIPQANAQSTSTVRERTILLEEINRDFDEVAQHVAGALADPAFRMLLWHEVQASRDKEKILDLKAMLTKAQGHADIALSPRVLKAQLQVVEATEEKMRAAQFPEELIGVNLYFPIESHRQQWRGGEEILVTFGPVLDDSEMTSIIAYSVQTGEPVLLDPNEVPNIPTLVIAAKDRLSFLTTGNTTVTAQGCRWWLEAPACAVVIAGGAAVCAASCIAGGGAAGGYPCYLCWTAYLGASYGFCRDCIPAWMRALIDDFEGGGGGGEVCGFYTAGSTAFYRNCSTTNSEWISYYYRPPGGAQQYVTRLVCRNQSLPLGLESEISFLGVTGISNWC